MSAQEINNRHLPPSVQQWYAEHPINNDVNIKGTNGVKPEEQREKASKTTIKEAQRSYVEMVELYLFLPDHDRQSESSSGLVSLKDVEEGQVPDEYLQFLDCEDKNSQIGVVVDRQPKYMALKLQTPARRLQFFLGEVGENIFITLEKMGEQGDWKIVDMLERPEWSEFETGLSVAKSLAQKCSK